MTTATHPSIHGHIVRRLSDRSFTTDDPEACSQWLRAIGYVDQPTRGTEYARLQLGQGGCIVWASGLVICLGGGQA